MTKHIAIIGGGVVGATSAFYLSKIPNVQVTIFDDGKGQGTSASAGIISPWLSKRRNKSWYEMVKQGAAFYPLMLQDVLGDKKIPNNVYQKVGTLLFTKKDQQLEELLTIGLKRREEAPEIGQLAILSPEEIKARIPIYTERKRALFAEGGARVDGFEFVQLVLGQAVENGANFIQERARLLAEGERRVVSETVDQTFDGVVLANAAWLPEILEPLGYEVDVRPQKGQLVELQTAWYTDEWPVVMPVGEKDIIPFRDGKILVGATHEDDAGFDLVLEKDVLEEMVKNVQTQFSSHFSLQDIVGGRVGTRAYTSDFAPFFGEVPGLKNVFAASGLGSTGLTAGPLVGQILSDLLLKKEPVLPVENYPIEQYVKKKRK